MSTTSELQVPRANCIRIFYLYADFAVRVDENSPVHFDFDVRRTDSQGMKWLLTFRLFALDRRGRLIIFEYKWAHSYLETPRRDEVVSDLIKKFAEPFNAIPGRIEVK